MPMQQVVSFVVYSHGNILLVPTAQEVHMFQGWYGYYGKGQGIVSSNLSQPHKEGIKEDKWKTSKR
jgi:hypothetical protein